MITLPILFEDGEALVIDKPAGLPIDRPRAGGTSLENYLDALRLGFQRLPLAVHRLDQDTSGCLLLARHAKAHKRFAAAFEARQVEKVYLGIVAGPVADDGGTIALNLSKISSAEKGWRMIPARAGKPAVTHWRVVERKEGLTLVEFRPETGRTHQIRVHLAHIGHPILGDSVYGAGFKSSERKLSPEAAEALGRLGRQALHAIRLGFRHPRGGRQMRFESPLPPAMQKLVDALRL